MRYVNKVLTSAADICSRGYRIVLGHGGGASYIEDLSTSEKINLRQQDGVYMHEWIVMPYGCWGVGGPAC